MRNRRGFTLVELLVVIGIIAVLLSIMMPAFELVRERSRRVKCQSNMRQIVLAACTRAAEEKAEGYAGQYFYERITDLTYSSVLDGGDDLSFLYPKYLSNLNVAVCPSTNNQVRTLAELKNNAASASASSGGHSYELRGWIWVDLKFPDGSMYVNKGPDGTTSRPMVKTIGNVKNPERMFLLNDQLDAVNDPSVGNSVNNWPTSLHNHGEEGVNVAFCDGHAEWVPTGAALLEVYMNSYYAPAINSGWFDLNGKRITGANETTVFNSYKNGRGLRLTKSGNTYSWAP